MIAVVLGHALVGVLIALGRSASLPARRAWIGLCGGVGVVLAALLPVFAGDERWRSLSLSLDGTLLLGVGATLTWGLVIHRRAEGDADAAAAVGIAVGAIVLMVAAEWIVPAALFTLAALSALAVAGWTSGWHLGLVRAAVALALLVGGLIVQQRVEAAWQIPAAWDPLGLTLTLAGAAVLAGALPLRGVRSSKLGATISPVLVVAGFALAGRALAAPQPWAAVAVSLLALALFARMLARAGGWNLLPSWAVLVGYALVLGAPGLAAGAGIATALAVTAVIVHRSGTGYGGLLSGVVAGFAPPTIGGMVLMAGALASLESALRAPNPAASAPWSALAGLLALSFAMGIVVTARLGRGSRISLGWGGLLWPGLLFGAAAVMGLLPRSAGRLPVAPVGAEGGVLLLYMFAVGAGGLAAWSVYAREDATIESVGTSDVEEVADESPPLLETRWLQLGSALVIVTASAAVLWLAIEGLKVGFL